MRDIDLRWEIAISAFVVAMLIAALAVARWIVWDLLHALA
jgi:hypothetical protein